MRWASVRLVLLLMASTLAPWGKCRMDQPERVGKGAIGPRIPSLVMAGPCPGHPRLAKQRHETETLMPGTYRARNKGKRP